MRLSSGWRFVLMAVLPLATVPSLSQAYDEVEVGNGGAITGQLTFSGALPEDAIELISITKNPEVCGDGNREVVWIDVADGALRGAFVFLAEVEQGKAWAPPEEGFLINQEKCRFRPWAQVIRQGAITIRNSDKGVLHNINTREIIGVDRGRRLTYRTMFNFGQPDPGDIAEEINPRRSNYIAINCEAHNFMFGFMMALEHPYGVVVGDDGTYSIDGVPPGDYVLNAWHPRLGLQSTDVSVAAGGTVEAAFEFTAE